MTLLAGACGQDASMAGDAARLAPPPCGDGREDPGEGCDDGNLVNGDGCSSLCQPDEGPGPDPGPDADPALDAAPVPDAAPEPSDAGTGPDAPTILACEPRWRLTCGDPVDSWSTAFANATDRVDTWPCSPWDESGREYAYVFTAPTAGSYTVTLEPTLDTVDLDLFLLGDSCLPEACLDYADSSLSFTATAGATYHLAVDGFLGDAGAFTITLDCP